MPKGICSEALKGERSEIISQESTCQVVGKRQASNLDEDMIRSAWKRAAVLEEFNSHVNKTDNGCWEWTGGKSHGYGEMRVKAVWGGAPIYAHRVSYMLNNGVVGNSHVLHRCDNPGCVNPAHLFLGTQADNIADMVGKGRQCSGEKNGQVRISDDMVKEIRERAGSVRQYVLSREYGISEAQVSRILRGSRRQTASGDIRAQHGNFKHGLYTTNKGEHK